jgi:ABC-type transporter Mla subunit MlaD
MDDVLLSLQDFMATFKAIRSVESERLALQLQSSEDLLASIAQQTDEIKNAAAQSGSVTERASHALRENDEEIEEAEKIEVRTALVADHLLVVRNFASEVTRAVATLKRSAKPSPGAGWEKVRQELSGIGFDSLKEIRANLPAGVGDIARIVPLVGIVGLLTAIAGPTAGLAGLISGFKPLAETIKTLRESGSPAAADRSEAVDEE